MQSVSAPPLSQSLSSDLSSLEQLLQTAQLHRTPFILIIYIYTRCSPSVFASSMCILMGLQTAVIICKQIFLPNEIFYFFLPLKRLKQTNKQKYLHHLMTCITLKNVSLKEYKMFITILSR